MQPARTIAIIGAGAAGLFAAIFAARNAPPGTRVVAFDGAKKLGAKILVSGGGRCNVTHHVIRADDYAGGSRNAIKKVLRSFTVDDTVAFFAACGVELKHEDTGKLFPTSDRARSILNALLTAAYDAGAELLTEHRVSGISVAHDKATSPAPRFQIQTSQGPFTAHNVILATGGLALPATGSDGFGYQLARHLGHTVTDTWPALVPLLLTKNHWLTTLSGIALDTELTLNAAPSGTQSGTGKVLHRQTGATLFTHFGLSGPAPMDISRHFTAHQAAQPHGATLTANLLPGRQPQALDTALIQHAATHPHLTVLQALEVHLPTRLAAALIEHQVHTQPNRPLAHLPKDARRRLVTALTALPLPITTDRGYAHAEVTAGGVPLTEIQLATMHSRHCPGLHLAGEILNVDGRIGGYNFQWAWCTGRLAGLAAATDINPDSSECTVKP
ncbi:MAG: NAD(P)/FAD-dependent oxidoreductase [Algisphaera sp.]